MHNLAVCCSVLTACSCYSRLVAASYFGFQNFSVIQTCYSHTPCLPHNSKVALLLCDTMCTMIISISDHRDTIIVHNGCDVNGILIGQKYVDKKTCYINKGVASSWRLVSIGRLLHHAIYAVHPHQCACISVPTQRLQSSS
jgi:hypothetical protein